MADEVLRDEADVTERGIDPRAEDPSSALADRLQESSERELEGDGLEPEQEVLTINMGPHHPATHGVLRLLVTLEAEVVRDLKPIIGYVHTGIEKTAEDKSYWKAIPVVERMDYLAYYFNAMAYVGAVETLEEHPRVGREGFDEAPLSFREERVEGQGGLARAGDARDHRDPVVGNRDRHGLEVVLPGSLDPEPGGLRH